MTKRSKILMIVVATLVIANVAVLGVLYFTNRGDDAQTTIVPENEDAGRVAKHIKSDLMQGKITKIDGDQVEYREIMDGTKLIPIDRQETKTAKIDEETRMYAPCLLFREYQAVLEKEEEGETEEETADQESEINNEGLNGASAGGVDPEEKCPGTREMLKIGVIVNFKVNDGKITYLSF